MRAKPRLQLSRDLDLFIERRYLGELHISIGELHISIGEVHTELHTELPAYGAAYRDSDNHSAKNPVRVQLG